MTKPYDDPERIREMYHGNDITIAEAADKLGTSAATLYRRMDKFGIETKQSGVSNKILRRPPGLGVDNQGYEIFTSDKDGEQDRLLHHRLLAVAEYGVNAVSESDVHHRNHVPWDNRPENLELLSRSDHIAYYNGQR